MCEQLTVNRNRQWNGQDSNSQPVIRESDTLTICLINALSPMPVGAENVLLPFVTYSRCLSM